MIWQDALEIIVARTKHERYRVLCSDSWIDHESWRAFIVRLAGNDFLESDAARAAHLIRENPPDGTVRPCGAC